MDDAPTPTPTTPTPPTTTAPPTATPELNDYDESEIDTIFDWLAGTKAPSTFARATPTHRSVPVG